MVENKNSPKNSDTGESTIVPAPVVKFDGICNQKQTTEPEVMKSSFVIHEYEQKEASGEGLKYRRL